MAKPKLTVAQILAWADAHKARTGDWPQATSGPIAAASGQTWKAVETALVQGLRGLPGRDSLVRLLRRRRGLPERRGKHGTAAAAAARGQRALRLRGRGLSLAEIGRRLGVSRQAVQQLLRRAQRDAGAAEG
jgi:DNA-binding CsgD family transcriptional regulator